ncbi:MAG: hypothetical protein UX17_C0065G0002 [Parcubacteria group bacterium GW2011_GWC2_45_7]|nr:MAG: hypothetical protein UX17_C0065G0002 [Parcubacteria group bacterium GW2011_GWC2_45_7]KKU73376.1 MAG: hypothetical protein UX98_C0008G0042 [Parcubacteria group bacterium GW2011_GWA2_47_26]
MAVNARLKSIAFGILASSLLLGLYFTLLTLISGWPFARGQFFEFWYFIVSLALGFGIQVGLYTYLKNSLHNRVRASGVLAVSGTTSTGAMISCCAHYLVNILPILGVTGLVSLVGQYQIQLFWVGLLSNIAGIAYITGKLLKSRM